MINTEFFNVLDYVYIGIMLISALVGLFRGFSRDFFGTCAWLLSGFLSIFAAPILYEPVGKYVTDPTLLRGVCLTMAFLTMLTVFLMITGLISSRVKESVFSGVDRAAGALFGLFRGICIIFTIFLIMLIFEMPQDKFAVVRDSKISSVLFAHTREVVAFMEKIRLVPKGYINKVREEETTKNRASVRDLMPSIFKKPIEVRVNFSKEKEKHEIEEQESVTSEGDISLSDAIAKRRRERMKQESELPDDRNAD